MSDARAGLLALYGSTILLATNGLFAKLIPLPATSITQLRSVVACAALATILVLVRSPLRLPSLREYIGVYVLGILLGVHWITYFYAMKISTVAIGMLALFSYPVVTVLIEPLFNKQWPRVIDIGAALLVFAGIFIMVSQDILAGDFSSSALAGALWGGLSAILFSLRNTTQKYWCQKINSKALMAHQALAIALFATPLVDYSAVSDLVAGDWLLILLLGCCSTAAAHTLLSASLKRLPAKSVALIGCLTPVVGGFFAWQVLAETPDLNVFIGGALILSVAALESFRQSKKLSQ